MKFVNILWVFFSYILGSIPFGLIITRFSSQKNILNVGWKKTSGSNVFKNIGAWQGVATGLLDVGKGFLAVWMAQYLGFDVFTQVLSGVAAVSGHNWSIFIGFAGGRGIGTLAGAALAFSPKILGISLIVPLLVAFLWNASIGTILLLILMMVVSSYYNQFQSMGMLALISLIPVFLKRLSPIRDVFAPGDKRRLINRLIFDDDKPYLELRIKRLLKGSGWWER